MTDLVKDQICYFGYGSLVNEETLPAGTKVVAGELSGWKREWRGCSKGKDGSGRMSGLGVCALGVRREEGSVIHGAMVLDSKVNLPALDQREWHYDRKSLDEGSFTPHCGRQMPSDTFLYQVQQQFAHWGCEEHPILQSYIDCVMAGFHRLWGQEGMEHFVETTDGWGRVPIVNDRADPYYPRAITLSNGLAAEIDDLLKSVNAQYLKRSNWV
ncbi:hypothetical protein PsAD2_02906 [Pseudovibrio axinellae]|uniref:Gamma-glutamylcyclotransferase AIG2-like domain-containing protein n=1 Tax=Pseudovibrio axinellae TaxID=989403 RepID=A0A165XKA0_9HYPH|nr:gamma-glutamylcyclotransferase family protein [Pseudovibrio axinellae]KZL17788.1 hypothetical protein PsAD2_02906 [Pseudovibrio axinellae]SEP72549.1 hypothetical protein SAMN05421798_101244 [Pseudovibrio axinellae]